MFLTGNTIIMLFILVLASCKPKLKPSSVNFFYSTVSVEKDDSVINNKLLPYKFTFDLEMNEFLVISEEPLIKEQPEGNLGDFVADCLLEKSKKIYKKKELKVHAVMINNGGLRASLPKGEITKGKIFELMPFDNELVLVSIKGSRLKEMLNFICEKGGVPVAGIRLEIDKNKKPVKVLIDNSPLDTNKIYGIISSDYLVEGGDNINFFRDCDKNYSGILIRDIIIDHCREINQSGKKIMVKTDGRITFSK